jgi:predicted TIM-barrel fold metal-dependent hydrolase
MRTIGRRGFVAGRYRRRHLTGGAPTRPHAATLTRARGAFRHGEQRLAAMDAADIDLAVLSATTPDIQGEKDASLAVRLARDTNDLLAREIQKQPRGGGAQSQEAASSKSY